MPSRHTFTIPPILDLLERYIEDPTDWFDPFAGWNSPAGKTNDLNPQAPTDHHEDAEKFVRRFKSIGNFLFDPPYSPRQISECYKSVGLKVGMKETQNAALYARVRDAAAPRIKPGGLVISCGWNTAGMGKTRGFEAIEVLIVDHGSAHNATLVLVERKQNSP